MTWVDERFPDFRPRAVVFDLDGVMVDSERIDLLAWRAVGARYGLSIPEEFLASAIGRRAEDLGSDFAAQFGVDYAPFVADVAAWHQEYVRRHGLPRKPGLLDLLDWLDDTGIRYAVATSTAENEARDRLGPILPRLAAAAFGNEVAACKPAPDVYRLAATRLGIPAERCLAIEDSLPGIAAAEAAGMTVIMVPDLVAPNPGVRHVCRSLDRVQHWLEQVLGEPRSRSGI